MSFSSMVLLYIWKLRKCLLRSRLLFRSYMESLVEATSFFSPTAVRAASSLSPKYPPFQLSKSDPSRRPDHISCAPRELPDDSDPHDVFFILNHQGLLKVGVGEKNISTGCQVSGTMAGAIYIFLLERIVSNFSKLNSVSQPWLHIGITWKAFKKSWCLSSIPSGSELISPGYNLSMGILTRFVGDSNAQLRSTELAGGRAQLCVSLEPRLFWHHTDIFTQLCLPFIML